MQEITLAKEVVPIVVLALYSFFYCNALIIQLFSFALTSASLFLHLAMSISSLDPPSPSLRDRQVLSLLSVLNFNAPPSSLSISSSLTSVSANGSAGHGSSGAGPLAGLTDISVNAPLPTWKVLVLDQRAQDVLATTLRVQDLRDNGVTLHMYAYSTKEG